MGRVDDKVVLVTGAGGGQGLAEARALAAEGATVIATDLESPRIDPAEGMVCRVLDVSSKQAWRETAEWVEAEHGRIDGLVNNAAVVRRKRILEIDPQELEEVLRVNLIGSLLGIQAVEPLMRAGGSIVNVSSLAGISAHFPVAYTLSKWAVRGLSRVASLELGPRGIRVNTILPGYIETPMTAAAGDSFREANIADTPLGRTGFPEEIAPLVVYLISGESSFVSGAEIVVDGGQSAHGGVKAKLDAFEREAEGNT